MRCGQSTGISRRSAGRSAQPFISRAHASFLSTPRSSRARAAMSGYPAVGPAACHPDSRLHWHSYVAAPEAALSPRQGHLLSIPVLLRTLALLGYYQGGERTRQLVQDPLWQARHATPERVGTAAQNTALLGYRKDTLAVLAAMLAVVTLARMLRGYREKRVGTCYSVARLLTPGKPYQTKVAVR